MAKALTGLPKTQKRDGRHSHETSDAVNWPKVDWQGKVSDHVAYALLVYTGLHIFVTMTALKGGGGSLLPYFALVILVVAIIPGLRTLERRWQQFAATDIPDDELAPRFRREMAVLWLLATGLPLALTAIGKALIAAF